LPVDAVTIDRKDVTAIGGVQSALFELPVNVRKNDAGVPEADMATVMLAEPGKGGTPSPLPAKEALAGKVLVVQPEQLETLINDATALMADVRKNLALAIPNGKDKGRLIKEKIDGYGFDKWQPKLAVAQQEMKRFSLRVDLASDPRKRQIAEDYERLPVAEQVNELAIFKVFGSLTEFPEAEKLYEVWKQLPPALQKHYHESVSGIRHPLETGEEVEMITQTGSVLLELESANALQAAANGFSIDLTKSTLGKGKGSIQNDIPVSHQDRLFIYEAKSFPLRHYGMAEKSLMQGKKYQLAIQDGEAIGAAIEIRGRIKPSLLESLFVKNEIPDVQVVFNMNLPSGKEYRISLKGGKTNLPVDDAAMLSDARDLEVVKGVEQAIAMAKDGKVQLLSSIVSGDFEPSAALQEKMAVDEKKFRDNPKNAKLTFGAWDINNIDTFRLFQQERIAAMHSAAQQAATMEPERMIRGGSVAKVYSPVQEKARG